MKMIFTISYYNFLINFIISITESTIISNNSYIIAPTVYASQLNYLGQKPIVVNQQNNNRTFLIANELRYRRSVFLPKQYSIEKYILQSNEKPAINKTRLSPRPRFFLSRNLNLTPNPSVFMCNNKFSNICRNKTMIFRNRIMSEFKKSLEEIINEPNYYNVKFKTHIPASSLSSLFISTSTARGTIIVPATTTSKFNEFFKTEHHHNLKNYQQPPACLVLKANVRVLRRKDPPFNYHPLGRILPRKKIFRDFRNIKSCAIVSSAGSLAGSKLGKFIDLHDIVMRFNHAPVEGYETDVGSKTTIRVVNSQVVTKPEFNFVNDEIFQNITIAAWDPGKYNLTLKDWLNNADFNLFTNYEIYRKKYPKSNAYLLDPHSIWKLWQQLQLFTRLPIRKNPPSSGFIGLALLLPYCPYIDFIEYIPSTRLNGKCHYYSNEMNSACTFGAWHPLAAEKLMTLSMNIADDFVVFQNGITRIRRPDKKLCG